MGDNQKNREEALVKALANLLEWAKGNRGSRCGNPYAVPEVRDALKTLGHITDDKFTGDGLDVNTKELAR